MRQFEAAGGSAVKCHNNINQRGVGAYGGDRGERWEGAMVHTEDRGEMVAAELAQHMGLEYDLNSVFRAYKVQQIHNSTTPLLDSSHYFIREVPKGIWRTYGSSIGNSRIFKNPLNAIRSIAGDRGFDEVPPVTYEPPSRATDVGRMTKAQLADLAFNLKISDGHIPRFHSPDEDWAELANEANTVRAYKAYNPHKDPDAIQRAAESACALQKQQQGLCTVNPVALLLRAFASGRCFALWLLLDSLGACGIFWALYGRSYLNYRSDMYEVVPGFEIPKPEGQGQHGTAWWLPKNEYSVVFNAADTGSNIELPAKLTELYREERRRADEIAFAKE